MSTSGLRYYYWLLSGIEMKSWIYSWTLLESWKTIEYKGDGDTETSWSTWESTENIGEGLNADHTAAQLISTTILVYLTAL